MQEFNVAEWRVFVWRPRFALILQLTNRQHFLSYRTCQPKKKGELSYL